MDLPSFLWLWRWAAWSMGGVVVLYGLLMATGSHLFRLRRRSSSQVSMHEVSGIEISGREISGQSCWVHILLGILLLGLVLELLAIGIVGTLGQFGSLGQSVHLWAGLGVTGLSLLTAWHGWQGIRWPSSRGIHVMLNGVLGLVLLWVSWTGWQVVQKYLP